MRWMPRCSSHAETNDVTMARRKRATTGVYHAYILHSTVTESFTSEPGPGRGGMCLVSLSSTWKGAVGEEHGNGSHNNEPVCNACVFTSPLHSRTYSRTIDLLPTPSTPPQLKKMGKGHKETGSEGEMTAGI
ncbi:hypothetical protein E2C01_040579 [Portunus trituberculatus]|uniref:Uncharacterized protein n=1 Tax=Portunus trituberculatus TaxID=210409 RepID=A0A5B7FNL7_PORTR|nr:hypothetical protein [Portunus trituberculatus]